MDGMLLYEVLLIFEQLNLHLFVGLVSDLMLNALLVAATEIAAGCFFLIPRRR